MLKYISADQKNFQKKLDLILNERRIKDSSKYLLVKKIIADIQKNKDKALIKYEKKFSKIKKINPNNIKLSENEIKKIIKKLNPNVKKSIDIAYNRITKFHKMQKLNSYKLKDKYNNSFAYTSTPINKVGVYVPGGTASYPSSVLMNCIPALSAGVKEIFMASPVTNKEYNPGVIYSAKKCKIKEIYKVGGAQAIAAMTYGTKTVKKVDKIVGPGNEYVALAKKEVFGDVGIDMIAGPSEVTVVADKFSNPEWVAADLIAQAEHDENAQSILISSDKKIIKKVNICLKKQLKKLPKKKIASASLKKYGYSIYSKNISNIINIINIIAPEHLELCIKKPERLLKKINCSGSIFLGQYSPEAIGDYVGGPNHVLPTSGSAKFSSGLSVYDFLKRHSIIKVSKSGLEKLSTSVINLAHYENLDGHVNSIKIRLKKKK